MNTVAYADSPMAGCYQNWSVWPIVWSIAATFIDEDVWFIVEEQDQ